MRERDLLKHFKNAPFILKIKMWTPKRSTIEIEGGYPEHVGNLLNILLSKGKYTAIEKQKVEELCKLLRTRARPSTSS